MNEQPMDPMDELLVSAFRRALDAEAGTDLMDVVMARIRRRQQIRMWVLGLVGVVAAVLCTLAAMPLIESLAGVLPASEPPERTAALPVLALVVSAFVFGGWLLMDEPV